MDLYSRVLLTTDETIKDVFLEKFSFIKLIDNWLEAYSYDRIIEWEKEKIIFVYFNKNDITKVIEYLNENFIVEKYVIIWFSKIVRNHDLQAGDIVLPNTIIDNKWEHPIFIDYAVWENYDLNKFWLVLNWVCMEKICNCNHCDTTEEVSEEFLPDIEDCNTYKVLSSFTKDEQEKFAVIRICTVKPEDKNNKEIVENLVNIVDVMI